MANPNNVLISIWPTYADAILNGTKTVELRKRVPQIEVGAQMWIYATRPIGAVVGVAVITAVTRGRPSLIWEQHGDQSGVTHSEFQTYFRGMEQAVAIELADARRIEPVSIEELRDLKHGFHPPQVMVRLTEREVSELTLRSEPLP